MVRLKGHRFCQASRWGRGNSCPQTSHTITAVGTRPHQRLSPHHCVSYTDQEDQATGDVALMVIYCLLLEPAASARNKRDYFRTVG